MDEEPLAFNNSVRGSRAGATVFDLELFLQLNEEHRTRPVIPSPRCYCDESRLDLAEQRAALLEERVGIKGRRVLEVGCGRGDVAMVLSSEYDCEVVGVDIVRYPAWKKHRHPNLTFVALDISRGGELNIGRFERIVSLVVWEHIKHPFSALKAGRDLLTTDGVFYLRANLYRSAVGSHRYREVYFPWPHLLFPDSVFEQFYQHIGQRAHRPAWLNKLTYAEYQRYFELLGFIVEREWLSRRPLDEGFYERFEDVLSRYPIFDLTLNFFDVVLTVDPTANTERLNPYRPRYRRTLQQLGPGYGAILEDRAFLRAIQRLGSRLLPGRRRPGTRRHILERLLGALEARCYQFARRLARRPRNLRYWLTLPIDLLRTAFRRRASGP